MFMFPFSSHTTWCKIWLPLQRRVLFEIRASWVLPDRFRTKARGGTSHPQHAVAIGSVSVFVGAVPSYRFLLFQCGDLEMAETIRPTPLS